MPHTTIEHEVSIPLARTTLSGTLHIPASASGIVVFAHGSGSSRFSPRNIFVARSLFERGCGTFLFDLLDESEAQDRRNVFDIPLLAERMAAATDRLLELAETSHLPIGYFGASTGAAAALVAAAQRGEQVSAVVSRGGRPDLAGDSLPNVTAPTLLLVGSRDYEVIELNKQAQRMMNCENQLSIIPGATHLFEEPGTLEEVARQASDWFASHFGAHD